VSNNYIVDFIDSDKEEIVYSTEIKNNMWSSPNRKFFTNWKINVYKKEVGGVKILAFSEKLDLNRKKVKINLGTSSLGDMIAYIDSVDRFQQKYNCFVDCILLNKDLIKSLSPNYKNINFISQSDQSCSYYASYEIGYFLEHWDKRIGADPRLLKLNHVPSYILGLDHKEVRPKLSFKLDPKPNQKYVCIATQSTSQCKYWNNENGWEKLIQFLNSRGYEVWCIDKYSSFGNKKMNYIPKGAIDKTGNLPLEERMSQIKNAEFFIGLGSGLSWLAWAVGVPVVLISGFSKSFAEFQTPFRIINEKVCNGCWNDPSQKFDPSNWMWCPQNKNFECTSSITPEMVIEKINNLL
jgi:autotransporter strand-loop-strand O-heptosyltransferase